MIVASILTVVLGAGVAGWFGFATWQGLQSRTWIPAEGVVTAIRTPRAQSIDLSAAARRVHYRYEVAGRRYAGDRHRFGAELIASDDGSAVHVDGAGKLSVGSAVTVYHDPNRPEQSVLVRGPSAGTLVFLLAGALLIACGLGMPGVTP